MSSYLVLLACIILLIGCCTALLGLFYGLVINSNIEFDVTNVLNLSGFSFVGLGMLCIAFSYILFAERNLFVYMHQAAHIKRP